LVLLDGIYCWKRDINIYKWNWIWFIWNFRSRSPYSPGPLPAPAYFRHGMPMYPSFSRRYDDYGGNYYQSPERSNGHDHRYRERGTRLTPPSTSARYNRR